MSDRQVKAAIAEMRRWGINPPYLLAAVQDALQAALEAGAGGVLDEESLMNLDQEHECWFCGWDQGVADDYVSTWRVNLDEGIRSDDRIELCRFCYIGYAASEATSGLQSPPADPRDMALFANLLLAEIRKAHAPARGEAR